MKEEIIFCCSTLTFFTQLSQSPLRQRPANLQALGNDGGGDKLILRYLLVQFGVGGLIEQHGIVQLIANLTLRPLLLFGLSATSALLLLGRLLWLLGSRFRIFFRRLQKHIRQSTIKLH